MYFIKAKSQYVDQIRKIAYYSEKHWGYSDLFMKVFEEEFNVTNKFLAEYPVYIGMEKDTPICFWGAIPSEEGCELEYFYVDVEQLGYGYGKVMWKHFIKWCEENGKKKISFVTSPQAVEFYKKMGAVVSGEALSTIDGRPIPALSYEINRFTKNVKKI